MKTESEILRDAGMKQAVNNADSKIANWSDMAYDYLLSYCKTNTEFKAEDVRAASAGTVPQPPHSRAWGAIMSKAARNNIIERVGYGAVKNPRAHCSTVTIWGVKNVA